VLALTSAHARRVTIQQNFERLLVQLAGLYSLDPWPDVARPGESRTDAAEIFAHVQVRITDLCAGTAAETLLHPDCEPWIAQSDIREARALASLICSPESAIDAYVMFGLAEAKALIVRHRAAVLAIANALMVHRTLDAVMIHEIIARAPGRLENYREQRG
jgi:hypothetical protein